MYRWLIKAALCFPFVISIFTYANDDVVISVFEDHQRYVAASDSYGLSWRLLEAAADNAGIDLKPQEASWRASMSRVQGGKVDLVFAAMKTTDRVKWANFSLPLITEGSGIFTKQDNPVSTFAEIDLATSLIGVSANSAQERIARELGFENVYSTVDRPQLYEMLKQNRLDYLLFGRSLIGYYCVFFDPSRDPKCMKQVGETLQPNNVHVMVSKLNTHANQVLQKLDKGLINISRKEKTRALFEVYDQSEAVYQAWLINIEQQAKK